LISNLRIVYKEGRKMIEEGEEYNKGNGMGV
jgi:hypothetical protein